MVRFFTLFFIFLFSSLSAEKVSLDASINQNQGWVNEPLKGTISITHADKDLVDDKSFEYQGKSLTVNHAQDVPMTIGSAKTIVSIYNFELPSKEAGLYVLEPVSVKVGGILYKSLRTSFQVLDVPHEKKISTPPAIITSEVEKDIFFTLESIVEVPKPFFPGQRGTFIYRITYNRSIDLTASSFPLFDVEENFKKIGDIHFKDYQKGDSTIQELTLEVEAYKTGTFQFGPAYIEGRAYTIDSTGQKVYVPNVLKAHAPGAEITVESFPIENEPASFNGTLAKNLDVQIQMKTPNQVKVGDVVELELTVTGPLNLSEMVLPDLKCQPGFSGFFQLDDLPPLAQVEGETKKFTIQMRPLSTLIQAVPSIELSALDPDKQEFIFWRSSEIPLTIVPEQELADITAFNFLQPTSQDVEELMKRYNIKVEPIKGFEAVLVKEFRYHWTETFWVLLLIPLGALLLFFQWQWRHKWQQPQVIKLNSQHELEKALREENPFLVLSGIKRALTVYMQERGYLLTDEYKLFMGRLDYLMYGRDREIDLTEIKSEAVKLIKTTETQRTQRNKQFTR